MNFPKHACGLFLTHNEHLSYDETVEQWLKSGQGRNVSFQSEASKAACIATNECWQLQWYPDTPIGFIHIAAPTLEELLEFAAEVEKTP
jgi:hypothetical protein